MKKLLTLILPALVLTAGPKQATGDAVSYHYHRGLAKESSDPEGAKADYRRAAESKADDAASYYERAQAKWRLGDNEGDDADTKRAAESKADDVASYYLRAMAKLQFGDRAGYKADIRRAAESKADDAASYYRRSEAKDSLGDRAGAIADIRRAAESKADDAASYFLRAQAKRWLDDEAGYKADIRRARESMIDDAPPQQAASPAPAPGDGVARYGAFAFDGENGATGFSVWYPSQSSAEQRALTECAQHGGENCEIKHRFPHRCAAVATAGDQGEWAWGFAADNSKPPAVERALAECRSRGMGACRVEASVCGQETN